MFLRRTQATSSGKRYDYIHLVESYRRPDGRPAHRVLANVTNLGAQALANLEQTLEANRKGRAVVIASEQSERSPKAPPKVMANLRYLDIALFLSLWHEWGLDDILGQSLPQGSAAAAIRPADVVACLVLQRCVEPNSKLAATRWLPRTALPQLMGIDPKHFNNTRLHRVLHELEQSLPTLMAKLPKLYQEQTGTFAAMFMDVTDTWFEGAGPPAAERAKTKEGCFRKKIGIVLLCNERGYPLRWEVIAGRKAESHAMAEMFDAIRQLPWVGECPVVIDRALGNTAHLRALLETKVRFLTSLVKTEFDNYVTDLPCDRFADINVGSREDATKLAAERIEQAGFVRLGDTMFVRDYGLVTYVGDLVQPKMHAHADTLHETGGTQERTIEAMQHCRRMVQMVADGQAGSFRAAAKALGLGLGGVVWKYLSLRNLTQAIQQDILEGRAVGRTLVELTKIAKMEPEAQSAAFEKLLRSPKVPSQAAPSSTTVGASGDKSAEQAPVQVRVVASFNPERFVEQRVHADQRVQEVLAFADNLNASLASPYSQRTRESILALVEQRLRKEELLQVFDVEVTQTLVVDRPRYQVCLTLDETEWAKRRKADGFTLLVAHPETKLPAKKLCQLYRDKDKVEKDFQSIKSVLELRPVRHRTDEKVRAHVALCMLALLLERILYDRLNGTCTLDRARELLDLRLNHFKAPAQRTALYTVTHPSREQRALLRILKATQLVDDDYIANRIARHGQAS